MEIRPVACTLSSSDTRTRLAEWDTLRSKATARTVVPHGAALTFPLDAAAEVEDLRAREATCCSFLDLAVDYADDRLTLTITSANPMASPTIARLSDLELT